MDFYFNKLSSFKKEFYKFKRVFWGNNLLIKYKEFILFFYIRNLIVLDNIERLVFIIFVSYLWEGKENDYLIRNFRNDGI